MSTVEIRGLTEPPAQSGVSSELWPCLHGLLPEPLDTGLGPREDPASGDTYCSGSFLLGQSTVAVSSGGLGDKQEKHIRAGWGIVGGGDAWGRVRGGEGGTAGLCPKFLWVLSCPTCLGGGLGPSSGACRGAWFSRKSYHRCLDPDLRLGRVLWVRPAPHSSAPSLFSSLDLTSCL